MNAPTILRKFDGRTNVVVEERPLTISRTDFIEAIEALWPAARFCEAEGIDIEKAAGTARAILEAAEIPQGRL